MVDLILEKKKPHDMDECSCGHTRLEHDVFVGREKVPCCKCECSIFNLVNPV